MPTAENETKQGALCSCPGRMPVTLALGGIHPTNGGLLRQVQAIWADRSQELSKSGTWWALHECAFIPRKPHPRTELCYHLCFTYNKTDSARHEFRSRASKQQRSELNSGLLPRPRSPPVPQAKAAVSLGVPALPSRPWNPLLPSSAHSLLAHRDHQAGQVQLPFSLGATAHSSLGLPMSPPHCHVAAGSWAISLGWDRALPSCLCILEASPSSASVSSSLHGVTNVTIIMTTMGGRGEMPSSKAVSGALGSQGAGHWAARECFSVAVR